MKYPLIIKLPKIHLDMDLNGITPRQIIADINAFEGVVPSYNEDTKKSEYKFSYIKQDMLSEAAFMALTQVPEIEAEGVVLYVVINNILDTKTPEIFPYSAVKSTNEDEEETSEQVTYREYFDVLASDEAKAVICMRFKRAGSENFLTEDYPNLDIFKLFYSVVAAQIIPVNGISLLSEKGARDYIEETFEQDI